jgi:hypothetical protein
MSVSPAPSAGRRRSRAGLIVVSVVALAGVALGVWLVFVMLPKYRRQATVATGASAAAQGETRKIHATLFFVADDGSELVAANEEVPLGPTPVEQARRIVEAEMKPPPAGMLSAVPTGTTVRAVYLTSKGDAFVDLSREVVAGHSGGSLEEALTVFAIVDALTVNLPDVTAVQILVDGKEVDTIAGHIDLRHPLARSLKWVRRSQ